MAPACLCSFALLLQAKEIRVLKSVIDASDAIGASLYFLFQVQSVQADRFLWPLYGQRRLNAWRIVELQNLFRRCRIRGNAWRQAGLSCEHTLG